jgi:thiamine biosynthesis lipoprotein
MNKKRYLQILFLLFLIVGTVLIVRQQHSAPFQKDEGMVFGTVYHVSYQSTDNYKKEIEKELKKVDEALSMFNPQSVISKVNNGESAIPDNETGKMFLEVVRMALGISDETNGAFDITVAPLVNAWGFGFKNGNMPTDRQVDSIRAFVGYKQLTLQTKASGTSITKKDARTMLDCSAIAKGYGCDVVARLLRKKGVTNYMIEIGGEVVTRGINDQRLPWRIGVIKPTDDSLSTNPEILTILNVTDKAMATSGNYRNFYYKNGRKYAHTIDPKTGKPVQHNILSSTVLANNCATADAYATSFMVMGLEGAKSILENHPELMAYFIYSDEHGNNAVWYSPTMKDKILDN